MARAEIIFPPVPSLGKSDRISHAGRQCNGLVLRSFGLCLSISLFPATKVGLLRSALVEVPRIGGHK